MRRPFPLEAWNRMEAECVKICIYKHNVYKNIFHKNKFTVKYIKRDDNMEGIKHQGMLL